MAGREGSWSEDRVSIVIWRPREKDPKSLVQRAASYIVGQNGRQAAVFTRLGVGSDVCDMNSSSTELTRDKLLHL
jgi:hypothetical protein